MIRWCSSHKMLVALLVPVAALSVVWVSTYVMTIGAVGTRFGVVPMSHDCVGLRVEGGSALGQRIHSLRGDDFNVRTYCVGRDVWMGE